MLAQSRNVTFGGRENGDSLEYEHKRIEPVGSNATLGEEANEPKGSWRNLTSLQAADKTAVEVRECWSTSNPEYLNLIRNAQNWAGLKSIAMVVCTRIIDGKESKDTRYYISSLNVERILQIVRTHWAIENELHWVLDVALNEDRSRVRKDQSPENLAVLRHIALNLLKQEKNCQRRHPR